MSHRVCPICLSDDTALDRPNLAHVQATCKRCGWHFTAGGYKRVIWPLFDPVL